MVFPPNYDPGEDAFAHLEFALKHEGVNLEVLSSFFQRADEAAFTRFVGSRPTGQYTRRAWFLYEWLTGKRLDLDDLKAVPYVPLIDPSKFHTARPNRSARHAVDENLLGTRDFCPMVQRTLALESFRDKKIDEQARLLLAQYAAAVVGYRGTLSKAKRQKFAELSDALVAQLEEIVRDNMLPDTTPRQQPP